MSDDTDPTPHAAAHAHAAGPSVWGTLFKRAFRADVTPGELLPDEQTAIEVEQIHAGSEPLKRVLLWRRGALLAALVFLVPSTLVHLVRDLVGFGGEGGANALSGLYFLVTVANIGLVIGAFVAFRGWERWGRSRRVLFWSWLIAFLVPFAVALAPLRTFVEGGGAAQALVGVIGALNAVIALAPKALSLVPGLLRAALTAKALFPGSATPGWLILLATPYYLLLLFVVMLMPYQLAGGGLMALALFCFLGAPIFLIVAGRKLSAPNDLTTALDTIHKTRTATMILNGAGGLFLFIGLIDLVSTLKLNPLDAVAPIIGIIANVFVLGVIGVDTTLVALTRANAARETPEQAVARAAFEADMAAFIAAQAEAQPEAARPSRQAPAAPLIDYDQPTERGTRRRE